MNKVILAGRLVRDPEVRYTQTGKAVASFTLAVNRRFSRSADQQQTADFIPIVVWDKLAEFAGEYVKKGVQVAVDGRIGQNKWTDKATGNERENFLIIASSIRLLGSKRDIEQDQL